MSIFRIFAKEPAPVPPQSPPRTLETVRAERRIAQRQFEADDTAWQRHAKANVQNMIVNPISISGWKTTDPAESNRLWRVREVSRLRFYEKQQEECRAMGLIR